MGGIRYTDVRSPGNAFTKLYSENGIAVYSNLYFVIRQIHFNISTHFIEIVQMQ